MSTSRVPERKITALIGPSGCGKSTFLRCLNRMNDTIKGTRVEGSVRLDGQDIYAPGSDVVDLRRRVGMVFQRPNPFPQSVFDNVAFGPRVLGLTHGEGDLRHRGGKPARRRPVGRGQGRPEAGRPEPTRSANSSACASRGSSRSSPK